jgi:hypothetical protein
MGFTVVGPDQSLGSGHPDFRDAQLTVPNKRPLLGLIESRDAGHSWQPLSLLGEADFHALQVARGRVYGYDATGGRFMVTSDHRHWQVRSKLELTSFAVSPTDPELVVAATDRGLVRSRDGGRRWQPIRGPAALLLTGKAPMRCGRSPTRASSGTARTPAEAGGSAAGSTASPRRSWPTRKSCMWRWPSSAS